MAVGMTVGLGGCRLAGPRHLGIELDKARYQLGRFTDHVGCVIKLVARDSEVAPGVVQFNFEVVALDGLIHLAREKMDPGTARAYLSVRLAIPEPLGGERRERTSFASKGALGARACYPTRSSSRLESQAGSSS